MNRARPLVGAKLVEHLEGSAKAKGRLLLILKTLTGDCTVTAAGELLGVSRRRFHELRAEFLRDAVASLEPRPVGRPACKPVAGDQLAALEDEIQSLRVDLRAAQVREEIAMTMPHLLRRAKSRKKRVGAADRHPPGDQPCKAHADDRPRTAADHRSSTPARPGWAAVQEDRRVRCSTAGAGVLSLGDASRSPAHRGCQAPVHIAEDAALLADEPAAAKLGPCGRGRPAPRSNRSRRQALLALIELLGPGIGVPTLQALCPAMRRREVKDILRRYRRIWTRRRRLLARVLHWRQPGTVWAIDFAEPPLPVDGRFGRLLAVRDLASGMQLLWLPVADESAHSAVAALESLFRQYGPPLVLKSDNGLAFIAGDTSRLLERWLVWHLRSPPEWPEYNGACEAGIGSMKARTHHQAARRGYPGEWTCDDIEGARLQANETARPWGMHRETPQEAWHQRQAISCLERMTFARAVTQQEACAAAGTDHGVNVATRRAAIARALVALGLLAYRRDLD